MKKLLNNLILVTCISLFLISCNETPKELKVAFNSSTSYCPPPCNVQFQNQSENADVFEWKFETGSSSSETNPNYTFADTGTYIVELKGTNTTTGESKFAHKTIVVQNLPLNVELYRIELIRFPCINTSSLTWDALGINENPDIKFMVYDNSDNLIYDVGNINVINNRACNNYFCWFDINYPFPNINMVYKLKIYDYDTSVDELMGEFVINLNPSSPEDTFTINSTDWELVVHYNWLY